VVIVAAAAVVVAAAVIAAGLGAGALWIFEVLAAVGLLVGLGAAFGVFDRRGRARRRRGHRTLLHPTASRRLSDAVDTQLGTLDPVEHRRLDLGDPWPAVIVGPTGVTVVAVSDRVSPAVVHRAREVLVEVRRIAAAQPRRRRVAVAAVLVLPDADVPPAPDPDVATVGVSDLHDVLARGPLVPMATVVALYTQLSGHLAADLHLDVV
jgi:hypothetical protein